MSRIRIMSNNIWKNDKNLWEELGLDCSAAHRARGFAEVYAATAADVIGLQESSGEMLEELIEALDGQGVTYAVLWGRDTPILYRADRFRLIDSAFALHPEACPGFDGVYNNKKTKSYAAAVFECKDDGSRFVFVSTHLWWKSSDPASKNYYHGSDEARAYQMGLVIDRVDELQEKHGCPAMIVGDFNARYDSAAVTLAFERGFVHAHDVATDYADEGNGHHGCGKSGFSPYVPKPFVASIDHILLRGFSDGAVSRFDRYFAESYLPLSDHLPLYVDIDTL